MLGEADRRLAAIPRERFDCDRAKADVMARTSVGVKGGLTVGSQAAIVGPSRDRVDYGHDDPAHRYRGSSHCARWRRVLLAWAAMRAPVVLPALEVLLGGIALRANRTR
jgi:hypothetical protein